MLLMAVRSHHKAKPHSITAATTPAARRMLAPTANTAATYDAHDSTAQYSILQHI
jgi:hypothetical protein